MIYKFKS